MTPADIEALRGACARLLPSPDHAELVETVSRALGVPARLAFVGAEWYRGGALVDGQGRRVAEDLEAWAIGECSGDMVCLFNRFADADYYVTVTEGRSLYLTAPIGQGAMDFIQVEVETAGEMIQRRLFAGEAIPDTISDLLVPTREARPLSPPGYFVRHVRLFPELARQLTCEHKGDARFRRFLAEWTSSSAGASVRFCDHWVLPVIPYQDSDGEHLLEARPRPVRKPPLPDLARLRANAVEYRPARIVQELDRSAGFPLAWYFLQVVAHYAPYRCFVDVRDDFRSAPAGVAPLAAHDMQLVDNWVEVPYNFH